MRVCATHHAYCPPKHERSHQRTQRDELMEAASVAKRRNAPARTRLDPTLARETAEAKKTWDFKKKNHKTYTGHEFNFFQKRTRG